MKKDNHYTQIFVELLSNNAQKLNELYSKKNNNIELTKKEILKNIEKRVGHGTSVVSYNTIMKRFSTANSLTKLMFLMSSHLLASDNLKIKK